MTINTSLVQGADAQDRVEDTMIAVRNAVISTMGPNGKIALIANGTAVKATKDGVTVARSINFSDPFQEKVARVITEAALKTDQECGDGTTTTVMLTAELYSILTQFPSFVEQRFIENAINGIIARLKQLTINVTLDDPLLYQLALTSSNNDEKLANLITSIYAQAEGRYPEVELKEGITIEDKVTRSNGLPVNLGFSNPAFSAHLNGTETVLQGVVPIVIDGRLTAQDATRDLVQKLVTTYLPTGQTLLIVCRNADNEVVQEFLNVNTQAANMGHQLRVVLAQTNAGGSVGTLIMQDMAIILGAGLHNSFEQVANAWPTGVADCIITVGTSRSVITELSLAATNRIAERVLHIENELSTYEGGDRFSQRARFNEKRIRDLKGELVTIFVGGETNSDVKERLDRFEDVVKAIKSALINGVLPGVGTSLYMAGVDVVREVEAARDELDRREVLGRLDLVPNATLILDAIEEMCAAPYAHLMSMESSAVKSILANLPKGTELPCTNLATGQQATAQELGVYDTAYATITALKGGFKTAKILANTSCILLGDKLSAVQIRG